jgi:hypothetical protein
MCQRNGITVWADPELMKVKKTQGHWHGNGHISVFRPDIKSPLRVGPDSTMEHIEEFVRTSTDTQLDLIVLLHEFGHDQLKHPPENSVCRDVLLAQERDAWIYARKIAAEIGMVDFSAFDVQALKALRTYEEVGSED